MEPFGILNFLKSILSVNDFTPNEPSSNMENQENFPNTTQEKSAQEKSTHDTQSQTKNVPLEETNISQQNAFTQFIENHDARVKRTRKD